MRTVDGGGRVEYGVVDYLAIAARRWWWVALSVLAMVSLAVAWTVTRPAVYSAQALVLVSESTSSETLDPGSQNPGFLNRELTNEVSLAYGDEVTELVVLALGELPNVVVSPDGESDVLRFRARASTAEDAALAANTWAESYIEVKQWTAYNDVMATTSILQQRLETLREQRREIRAPLDELDDRIARATDEVEATELQREYDRLADDLSYELDLVASEAEATVDSLAELSLQSELAWSSEARLVERAFPPVRPVNASLARNLAMAVVLGLLGGIGLALLVERRDSTIKSSADVQKVSDLPVLAAVPEASGEARDSLEVALITHAEGVHANAYHKARSSIEFLSLDRDIRSILVTSAGKSEGKTTTSCNLAVAFALVGKRTLLVDVDFRRPRLHSVFNTKQLPGMSDAVVEGMPVARVAEQMEDLGLSDLSLVVSGTEPPSPSAFVGTKGFLKTMATMRDEAEILILDAPPVLAVSDPATMAKHVDSVVLTAMAGSTSTKDLAEAIEAMRIAGADLLGIILVGAGESESYGRYYGPDVGASDRLRDGVTRLRDFWNGSYGQNVTDSIRAGSRTHTRNRNRIDGGIRTQGDITLRVDGTPRGDGDGHSDSAYADLDVPLDRGAFDRRNGVAVDDDGVQPDTVEANHDLESRDTAFEIENTAFEIGNTAFEVGDEHGAVVDDERRDEHVASPAAAPAESGR